MAAGGNAGHLRWTLHIIKDPHLNPHQDLTCLRDHSCLSQQTWARLLCQPRETVHSTDNGENVVSCERAEPSRDDTMTKDDIRLGSIAMPNLWDAVKEEEMKGSIAEKRVSPSSVDERNRTG